jgi:peptide/nickel transport system substrate-binding protein
VKRWIAALSLFALLAASCAKQERASAQTPLPGVSDDTPQEGGTLIRRLESDITTMSPLSDNNRYDKDVHWYLYTPVVYLDQDLKPVAGLAEAWEISKDGRTYTFHLNPAATFDDRQPVRASDLLFTLRKIIDPASDAGSLAPWFEGIDWANTRATDDHTAVISFREARAGQIYAFGSVGVMPEHVYSKGDFIKDTISNIVGCGPYRLVKRVPGREILLERREDYFLRKPYIRHILFKVVTDDNTAWNAMKSGELDESIISSDIWALEGSLPAVKKTLDLRRFYYFSYNFIPWNTHDPLLQDKRVRRALAMCADRKAIIANVYRGTARAMTGPFPPDEFGYNPNVPAIEYDPQGALKILGDLGWKDTDGDGILDKDGQPFKLTMVVTGGSKGTMPFVQVYQSELKGVGIQLDVEELDATTMISRVLKGNFQCAFLSWDLDVDPDPFAILHSSQVPPHGQNFVFFSNAAADRLIDAARHEMDESKRKKLYQDLHALLADEQPYMWVVQVSAKWAINRRVHDVKEARGYGLYLWYPGPLDWYIPTRLQRRQPVGAPTSTR